MARSCRVSLLGRFEVEVDGEVVPAEAFARAGHPLAEARSRAAAESADAAAAPRNGSGTPAC